MWPYMMGSMGWWMVLWWTAGIVVLVLLGGWTNRFASMRERS